MRPLRIGTREGRFELQKQVDVEGRCIYEATYRSLVFIGICTRSPYLNSPARISTMPHPTSDPETMEDSILIAIDRGGTFTDVWASVEGEPDFVFKLLSVDPDHYKDAPTEGVRRVLCHYLGQDIPKSEPLPKKPIRAIRMGTTVATNALLERKGSRHAFLVTKGHRDVLEIGSQQRPNIFALDIRKAAVLYDTVVEIDERVTLEHYDEEADRVNGVRKVMQGEVVSGVGGELIRVLEKLNEDSTRASLQRLRDEGYTTVAVCLAHSFLFPDHERRIEAIAKEIGFEHVSLSSAVGANMVKMVSRGGTASADAYLTPETNKYIAGFAAGFEGGNLDGLRCEFMQSGLVGFARTSYDGETPVVGFDMGGTSTDVSRFGGTFDHVFETTTAGVTIQSPQLDINTVAAGGGSILFWENGLFRVGPESAGAHPGPAAYRKGGPLTITDANLLLGRLLPEFFPKIFGPNEDQGLDVDLVRHKFEKLADDIRKDTGRDVTPEEVAVGFIEVANETMCRPIRSLTEARGFEIDSHNLAVFGGAGGQHACEIAENLGISKVVLHKYSSLLSAYGMALAEVVQEAQEPCNEVLTSETMPKISARHDHLRQTGTKALLDQGVDQAAIKHEVYLNLRYRGSDTTLMILEPADGNWKREFIAEHLREFSFKLPDDREVLVDDIRVRAIGISSESTKDNESLQQELQEDKFAPIKADKLAVGTKPLYFKHGGFHQASILLLKDLAPGNLVTGPAVIIDDTQTVVVAPKCNARVLTSHIIIDVEAQHTAKVDALTVDPVQLSVFGHRFMSIAEQMGRSLQKTSVSLNIKERLDFACAIFGPTGDLVANAPHVPVFLGSMSYAVKGQIDLVGDKMRPGDVFVTNHPSSGGTHLPDLTVVTPVFDKAGKEILFFLASRGHHTDIGGSEGTSMPPNSTELWQEGVAIHTFTMIRDGNFDHEGIAKIFAEPGTRPGCNSTQRLSDNITDLQSFAAANNKGAKLLNRLMDQYGQKTVQFYMDAIQSNAEIAIRGFLKKVRTQYPGGKLNAVGYMDNSSRICLEVRIREDGSATFDFSGTTPELHGNMNAPKSLTYSGVIFCLRTMIGADIPLNQGCLSPVDIIVPEGCFLNPSEAAAVCAGNTHTSQRICDTILQAFEAAAASQGCMNCVGFFGGETLDESGRTKGFRYAFGETVCGGAGAGPTWHGASAVHTHMTNTRITDAELVEKRYPVLMREFSIRRGSGGKGTFNGGDGTRRVYEALAPLSFSVITERRTTRPYGLRGGEPGAFGANIWNRKQANGTMRAVNLGQRNI
ncbi:hydantoinase B oxoprolinase [Fusarium albosuccineum]|uniref:Hydantoinase B oxoprolinase n=1 Tax=Fusarium albosuccineum TaxID=1237068 RepID=A0A8H4L704_9HYPO|nr:hydantoinase B oxoprolinase [Fusarium albosuccineum]